MSCNAMLLSRIFAVLAIRVAHAAQDRRITVSEADLRRLDWGTGDLGFLFELAAMAGVGTEADGEHVRDLVQDQPHTQFAVIDISAATCTVFEGEELLVRKEEDMVGVAIAHTVSAGWLFWRPISYPHEEARLLRLPEWKNFTL